MATVPTPRIVQDLVARLLAAVERLHWLAPLLGRLAVGLLFLSTGWGKVHSLAKVAGYFRTLGIPAAGFNAVLVSYTELVGGSCLVLGLLTRLAAIALSISMVVAILTARIGEVHNVFDLVGLDELTYLVVLLMIAIIGPGRVSIDRLLATRLGLARSARRASP